ncbi:MAG: hypothetical protein WHU94_08485 [Thermogemmata sp.]|nr:hypothetical protein [Thermogemmata fonticola]MCX8139716.1 hypothetical protein [Gemmataceae bacterium]
MSLTSGAEKAALVQHHGGTGMAVRLKLYNPPVEEPTPAPEPEVRVRLGDLLPLFAVAQRMNYVWLRDFLDDEVAITSDLYEVLQAFRENLPTPA